MIDEKKLIDVSKKYDINFIGLFGSFARGKAIGKSDIDLLVRFSKRKSLLDIVIIERKLSEFLGIAVDLLTEKSISPYIRENIKEDLKVILDEK